MNTGLPGPLLTNLSGVIVTTNLSPNSFAFLNALYDQHAANQRHHGKEQFLMTFSYHFLKDFVKIKTEYFIFHSNI